MKMRPCPKIIGAPSAHSVCANELRCPKGKTIGADGCAFGFSYRRTIGAPAAQVSLTRGSLRRKGEVVTGSRGTQASRPIAHACQR